MKEIQNNALINEFIINSGYKENFSVDVLHDTKLFHFASRGYIVEEGCQPTHLFYLVRGRAKLYVTYPNGRVSLVDFFGAPCFIGEIELVDKSHQPLSVQAIEDCWCLALPMNRFRPLLLNDVTFLHKLCVMLCHKNHRNISSFTKNQSFPLANRLAAFILFTQHNDLYHEKHTLVAEYMGISYRHLLYVISQFTRDDLLSKTKIGYFIKDRQKLTTLALEMDLGTINGGSPMQLDKLSGFLNYIPTEM